MPSSISRPSGAPPRWFSSFARLLRIRDKISDSIEPLVLQQRFYEAPNDKEEPQYSIKLLIIKPDNKSALRGSKHLAFQGTMVGVLVIDPHHVTRLSQLVIDQKVTVTTPPPHASPHRDQHVLRRALALVSCTIQLGGRALGPGNGRRGHCCFAAGIKARAGPGAEDVHEARRREPMQDILKSSSSGHGTQLAHAVGWEAG